MAKDADFNAPAAPHMVELTEGQLAWLIVFLDCNAHEGDDEDRAIGPVVLARLHAAASR